MSFRCLGDIRVENLHSTRMVTCPSCGQESPEGFKFCGNCGAALATGPTPRETRKTVTVVFSDVTGSTKLGEQLDPESLRRVMGRYFDEMQAVVERHEGTVEKFIGDAVMAVFGIPLLHEDDALRAVRAAAEMRERLHALNAELERDWGVRIEVRTGVNTGEVVAGDGSAGQRLATGDAVNVAKRFEEAAPPGEILLGETTWRLVRDAVDVESENELELKGKGSPVRAFRLLSIEPGAAGRACSRCCQIVATREPQARTARAPGTSRSSSSGPSSRSAPSCSLQPSPGGWAPAAGGRRASRSQRRHERPPRNKRPRCWRSRHRARRAGARRARTRTDQAGPYPKPRALCAPRESATPRARRRPRA